MARCHPLALLALAGAIAARTSALADVPRIGRPRPLPPGASTLPSLPPATIDEKLEIGGTDLKAKRSQTRLTVDTRVNGRGPYRFLVDSGADTSVVGVRLAQSLQLPLGTPVVLNAMTSRNVVQRVRVDHLQLGRTLFQDLHLPALREDDLGSDGIIGIDALVSQRLMMDFEKQTIKVEDARTPARMEDGEIVVTARRRRGQLILTEVRTGRISLDAVIDTGSEISIGNEHLRSKLVGRKAEFETIEMTGVTGQTVRLQVTTIPTLRLGSVLLANVPIAFADLPPFAAFGLNDGPALLLGTDVLATFRRVSLDFRSRKVRFQLRRCATSGVYIDTLRSPTLTRLSSSSREACAR